MAAVAGTVPGGNREGGREGAGRDAYNEIGVERKKMESINKD